MIRLWVNGSECTVSQDLDVEFTYKATDAEGIEFLADGYSTTIALPRCETNVDIFSPLFDIHTLFGSATFDINASVDAIIMVAGRAERGYVKMESIDSEYHLRFYTGLGLVLSKMENTKLGDLTFAYSLPYDDVVNNIDTDYSTRYGTASQHTYFGLFPAFSDNDTAYDTVVVDSAGSESQFLKKYMKSDGTLSYAALSLNHHQAAMYNASTFRCSVQMQYLFRLIMTTFGITFDYTTAFFDDDNPYWVNLFMVLKQQQGTADNPVSIAAAGWMPDITCKDFIVGYMKLFGLRAVYDGTTLSLLTRAEYYTNVTVDISEGIDRGKGIIVTPNPYAAESYACTLTCEGEDTGHNPAGSTNIYEGVPFKYAEMMQYVGPRGYGREDTSPWLLMVNDQIFTFPYINSTDGGELIFRFDTQPMDWLLLVDDITTGGYDGIDAYDSYQETVMPLFTSILDSDPLFAYKDTIKYNYDYNVALTTPQDMYTNYFKDYVDEVQSTDNAQITVEGTFPPATLAALASCRPWVMVDNVRCRILSCVTNLINKAKMVLQKLKDKSNITSGQGFTGYYLNVTGVLYLPDDLTIGDTVTLPVDTNDTITAVSGFGSPTGCTWTSGRTVSITSQPTASTMTFAGSTAYYPSPNIITVTTSSGLSETFYAIVYHADAAVVYDPNIGFDFDVNDTTTIIRGIAAMYVNIYDNAELKVYDSTTQVERVDTAAIKTYITQSGLFRLKVASQGSTVTSLVRIAMVDPDDGTVYAVSNSIPIVIQ